MVSPQKPRPIYQSGIEDILERLVAAQKKPELETDNIESKPCLRDRTFTKEELSALEKKKWIEIKDLIF